MLWNRDVLAVENRVAYTISQQESWDRGRVYVQRFVTLSRRTRPAFFFFSQNCQCHGSWLVNTTRLVCIAVKMTISPPFFSFLFSCGHNKPKKTKHHRCVIFYIQTEGGDFALKEAADVIARSRNPVEQSKWAGRGEEMKEREEGNKNKKSKEPKSLSLYI